MTPAIPEWLDWVRHRRVITDIDGVLHRAAPTSSSSSRSAAVLVLFGGSAEGNRQTIGRVPVDADVLLTQRAAGLRDHSGQVAFPGGAADPEDSGPIATALREAHEETGLDTAGVQPLTTLSPIFIPPSRFTVTPVVAYWRAPSPVAVVDTGESQRVLRVPIAELVDPVNRFQVRSVLGYTSPAFHVAGMLMWGFTAGVLAALFAAAGWAREWDTSDVRNLEATMAAVSPEEESR